jgi:DNA-binding beta-propeller fold protein YncE
VKDLNEPLLASTLTRVFDDPDGRYGHLVIFQVPTAPVDPSAAATPEPPQAVSMFVGGEGTGPGRFKGPRGIAVNAAGEVFVADTDNHRIQRFSPAGDYLAELGGPGSEPGRLNQPNGLAIDASGHLFVADSGNHRVQELDATGRFVQEWRGPEPTFYGPRDVVVAGGVLYVLDQGRGRVVVIRPDGRMAAMGSLGSGAGQLRDPTGLAVAGDRVYVADAANGRLAIFTTGGDWIGATPVAAWSGGSFQVPDVIASPDGSRIFASGFATNEVLVLSRDGERLDELRPAAPGRFEAPGAMALTPNGDLVVLQYYGRRVVLVDPTP